MFKMFERCEEQDFYHWIAFAFMWTWIPCIAISLVQSCAMSYKKDKHYLFINCYATILKRFCCLPNSLRFSMFSTFVET